MTLARIVLLLGLYVEPMMTLRSGLKHHRSRQAPADDPPVDDGLEWHDTTEIPHVEHVIDTETYGCDHGNCITETDYHPGKPGEIGPVDVHRHIVHLENGTHGHFIFEEPLCDSELWDTQEECENFRYDRTVFHAMGKFNFSKPITEEDELEIVAFTGTALRPETGVTCAPCGEDCELRFDGDENESFGQIILPDCPVPAGTQVDYMFINVSLPPSAGYMADHTSRMLVRIERLANYGNQVFEAEFIVHMNESVRDRKKRQEYLDKVNPPITSSANESGTTLVPPTDEMMNP